MCKSFCTWLCTHSRSHALSTKFSSCTGSRLPTDWHSYYSDTFYQSRFWIQEVTSYVLVMVHIIECRIFVLLFSCPQATIWTTSEFKKKPVPPIVPKLLQSITNATHTTDTINKQMQHMTKRAHLPRPPCYLDYMGCIQLYRILPSTDYTQGMSQTVDLLEPEWIQYQLEP